MMKCKFKLSLRIIFKTPYKHKALKYFEYVQKHMNAKLNIQSHEKYEGLEESYLVLCNTKLASLTLADSILEVFLMLNNITKSIVIFPNSIHNNNWDAIVNDSKILEYITFIGIYVSEISTEHSDDYGAPQN